VKNLVIMTFTEILEVSHPGMLEYEAFAADGASLSLPGLGLKPAVADAETGPQLQDRLLSIVREFTGKVEVQADEQGDIGPIDFGTISAFARVVEGNQYIRLYCPILQDIEVSSTLLTRLNELNCINGYMHVCHLNDCITAVSDLPAIPLQMNHVTVGLCNFLELADEFASELVSEFGNTSTIDFDNSSGAFH